MTYTLLLRFRDHSEIDTITAHTNVIEREGHVWWGWWKKENEPDRISALVTFSKLLTEGAAPVGLYDRSTQRFFCALCTKCEYAESDIPSPEIDKTPQYYLQSKLPAWLQFTKIDPIPKAAFQEFFAPLPHGDYTLYPVQDGRADAVDSLIQAAEYKPKSNVVLHLSDLHFGDDYGFPTTRGPGKTPLLDVMKADFATTAPEGIGVIAISGDLSSRGDANTLFDQVPDFLTRLCELVDLPKEAVLIVPGNHDFALRTYQPTNYSHENAFWAALKNFYGEDTQDNKLRSFFFPCGRQVEFLLINSVKLRKKEESQYGFVEWSLYDDMLNGRDSNPESLRVAVLHHHLISMLREEPLDGDYPHASVSTTVDSGAVIEGLQKHDFHLALHGHQHMPGVAKISRGIRGDANLEIEGLTKELVALSAGSAGAKAERLGAYMRDNSFNLIRVDKDKLEIEARHYTPGAPSSRLFHTTVSI